MADQPKTQDKPAAGIPRPTGPAGAFLDTMGAQGNDQPFGWLGEILKRVMGQDQVPQAPGAPPAADPTKGKKADAGAGAQPTGAVPGGMIAPGQATVPGTAGLANVVQPNAAQSLGMAPQTQGDFAWVLQAMQHAHDVGVMKSGGGDIVSALSSIFGGGPAPSGGTPPAAKG